MNKTQAQTIPNQYGELSRIYDIGMTMFGFKRGLNAFIRRITLPIPQDATILEIGAGTGIISFALLKKFPNSHITATDIEPRMVQQMKKFALDKNISERNLLIGKLDANKPDTFETNHGKEKLPLSSFDLIICSGVLEHTKLSESLNAIARLIHPGGFLLNISVREGPAGWCLSKRYHFRIQTEREITDAMNNARLTEITSMPFKLNEYSACFTRTAVLAKKRNIKS
jgi:ubiquinone/menaquinone biosynthesis C-methylase UbiE